MHRGAVLLAIVAAAFGDAVAGRSCAPARTSALRGGSGMLSAVAIILALVPVGVFWVVGVLAEAAALLLPSV